MRYRVWAAISCLTLLLSACGKSERDNGEESDATAGSGAGGATAGGATAGSATTGGSGVVGGGGTGASVSTGGTSAALGGSMAMGGMNVGGGETAEAGAPAAGGAAACSGYYHACGCGCCGAQPSAATCVYPDLGQDLTKISEQDLARRQDIAGCAAAGCSIGQDYFCCAAPPASNDGASYETSLVIGAIDRIRLYKMTTACSTLTLEQRSAVPQDPQAFPVEMPTGWRIASVTSLPCSSSMIGPNAIGAIGELSLRVQDDACFVDAHLAAFFTNDKRELNTVRFDADGVPVDIPVAQCK